MSEIQRVQLSPSVFLYNPDPKADTKSGPQLIIFAAWAFAQENHISKYVAKHQELFPGSTILVLKSFLRHMFFIQEARRELIPAVEVIRNVLGTDTALDGTKEPSLFIHTFSNTGLSTTYNLADVYAETASPDDKDQGRLPLHATVLDSTPGRYEYRAIVSAVMFGVPRGRWLQRLVSLPLAHLLSSFMWVWIRVLGGRDWVPIWGDGANDPSRTVETCRSYVYSRVDPLVPHFVVEAHVKDAQDKGYSVLHQVDFGDSAHVTHARADPERYWKIVKETWEA
ncbi:hypothetical protein B0J15DRAFT_563124 [Fusarium solani]|uniref:Indole-diterpene biosynthesis protein PaxU n=1 Tax=Fusarium solani TaxID=169388 RepID=A0A9P9GYB6_FUSSL|nr:uncharacterized protein B0J15DRAFT_563124 [Fusarium solani]KAH7247773.1 hypothetical protein B0J15DRAFT_563124 [Fusarium solani]